MLKLPRKNSDIKNYKTINLIKYSDSEYFIGNLFKNKIVYGKYFSDEYIYHGQWFNDSPEGDGVLKLKKKNVIYKGIFKKGLLNGKCEIIIDISYKFKGFFKNGKKNGEGTFYFNDTIIFKGIWYEDALVLNNNNMIIYNNIGQKKYELNDFEFNNYEIIMNGEIKEYFIVNNIEKILYEGEVKNNKYFGFGTLYTNLGNKYCKLYEGYFENGNFDGVGIIYNSDGNMHYSGNFSDGLINNNDKEVSIFTKNYNFIGKINGVINEINSYCKLELIKNNIDCGILNLLNEDKDLIIKNKNNLKEYNLYSKKILQFKALKYENYFEGDLYLNNIRYSGLFKINDKIEDINQSYFYKGTIYINDLIDSSGVFFNGKLNGYGKKYINCNLKYEGQFKEGYLDGNDCKIYYSNNVLEYSGCCYKGYKHGEGVLYDNSNNLIFKGKFRYNDFF